MGVVTSSAYALVSKVLAVRLKIGLPVLFKHGWAFFLICIGGLFAAVPPVMAQTKTPAGVCPSLAKGVWDKAKIDASKASLLTADSPLKPALRALMDEAQASVAIGPWSVTDKTSVPPSGNIHDYYSIGPYWWPDPKKLDGLPYIRRDGEVNPARNTAFYDSQAMGQMSKTVTTLALAGYFGDRSSYSERAALLIRTWFTDPDTRMSPHLDYAQSIPGRTDGRGIGIIDTYRLVSVVDASLLLERAGVLNADDMATLRRWFADYALWMVRSENGRDERMARNNHGLYYDTQLAVFATFAGDSTVLPKILQGTVTQRIKSQIDIRGRMPHELKRTRPFHYTGFSIQALIDLAELGRCDDPPLYHATTKNGVGLTTAADFHASYANRISAWPYAEIREPKLDLMFENLCRGADAMKSDIQRNALAILRPKYKNARILLLTNGCMPG